MTLALSKLFHLSKVHIKCLPYKHGESVRAPALVINQSNGGGNRGWSGGWRTDKIQEPLLSHFSHV